MKRRFNTMRKIVLCFIICALIGQALSIAPVRADGKVSSSESFSGSGIVTIDEKAYLKPLPPSQGGIELKYKIKNEENADIGRIRIQETLQDRNGNIISGPEAIIGESGISTGQTRTYSGKTYLVGGEGGAYSILYSLWYQEEGSDEWIAIKENATKAIEAVDIGIHAIYQAKYSGSHAAGQEMLYTAELKSSANVRLENIEVKDSVFGTLGTIAVLHPGERAMVSRAFKVEQTTESYIILNFNDPMGIQEKIVRPMNSASVRVEVAQEDPIYALEVTGDVDEKQITSEQEVDFIFQLKNSGNKALADIKGIDWNGNEFYSREQLLPGQQESITYSAKVSPGGSYEIIFSGIAPKNGKKTEATYKVEFPKIEPDVDISCEITPQEVEPGDTVTLQYTLKNTGDVALVDVRVEEPQFGEVAEFDKLEPGEEKSFSIQEELGSDAASHPHVYGKDEDTGTEYEFVGELQDIVVKVESDAPHLDVSLSANPDTLAEEGSVELICTIRNDGGVKINNIEAVLKERDMNIGSILVLEPGEEQDLSLSGIGVDEDESFIALIKGRTEDGDIVEFTSPPCEVTIDEDMQQGEEEQPDSSGEKQGESRGNSKLAFLKNLLAIIIVLALLTIAGLVYMVKDLGKGKGKAKKHYKKDV